MSAATFDALKEAIDRHVRAESPGSITGAYVVICETTNLDDLDHDDDSMYVTSHGSSFTIRGMVEAFRHDRPIDDEEDDE